MAFNEKRTHVIVAFAGQGAIGEFQLQVHAMTV
jgi:hypothetical protein